MIRLKAIGAGKKFHRNWIFRNVNFDLQSGDCLLITGSNGSGKSTLLRMLAGQLTPCEGEILLKQDDKTIDPEKWYQKISWSGPYMDLYPDLTLSEMVKLHFSFKKPLLPVSEIIQKLSLEAHAKKELRHFSSGMLHRVKVGLSLFSQSDILILDEASTNMDKENGTLIWQLTQDFQKNRILIWASNNESEFSWFDYKLDLKPT